MTRQASGDRMNGELNLDVFAFKDLYNLSQRVLRLRYGEAITGNDNYLSGVLQKVCSSCCVDRMDFACWL